MSTTVVQTLIDLPLDLLVASDNVRRTVNEASVRELADSIKATGLAQPILVRPHGKPNGHKGAQQHFELVTGQRRVAAARLIGGSTIAAVVREMTDEEAAEIQITENLQREDVPALEEAEGYGKLLGHLKTPTAIAQKVGKEVSYVSKRLQLLQLGAMPRKALDERLITIDHALLLARLGEAEQDTNLKWALNPNSGIKEPVEETIKQRIQELDRKNRWSGYWEPQSVLDLKHHIEQNVGRKLSRAPWALDVKLLGDAPVCAFCPSNTKHNDTLFGDLNIAAATCEDGGCFERKRAAFVQIRLSDATNKQEAGRGPAIRLSWKETTVKPHFSKAIAGSVIVDESGVNLMQTFKRGQWVEAKPESCKHVRLGVTVDWSDDANRGYMGSNEKLRKPGEILTICVSDKCKVHRKGYQKQASSQRDSGAEKAKREKRRQAAIAESKLRMIVATKAIESIKSIPAEALRNLVMSQVPNWGDEEKAANALLPGLKKIVETAKVDSIEFACAVAIVSLENLSASEYDIDRDRKEFLASVKRLGFDAGKAWKELLASVEKTPAVKAAKKPAKKNKGGR